MSTVISGLGAAQQAVLVGVEAEVAKRNVALLADFQVVWSNYEERVETGQPNAGNAPVPPFQWVVGTFPDPVNPAVEWPCCVQGTTPICPPPATPVPPPAATPAPAPPDVSTDWTTYQIGQKIDVPKGDTFPIGIDTVDPAGGVWQKMVTYTPFGVAPYYQKIA
jgi:hypothetical protein